MPLVLIFANFFWKCEHTMKKTQHDVNTLIPRKTIIVLNGLANYYGKKIVIDFALISYEFINEAGHQTVQGDNLLLEIQISEEIDDIIIGKTCIIKIFDDQREIKAFHFIVLSNQLEESKEYANRILKLQLLDKKDYECTHGSNPIPIDLPTEPYVSELPFINKTISRRSLWVALIIGFVAVAILGTLFTIYHVMNGPYPIIKTVKLL